MEQAFDKIPFYQKHPYMKPFVGERYESPKHNKLVIIGESHYLPANSTIHLDIDKWYKGECSPTDEEKEWCHTRNARLYGYGNFFQQPIEKDLKERFAADFGDVASFNYFLRPANKGRSFKKLCTKTDRSFAAKNLKQVLDILEPNLIVFASFFVFDCAAWKDDFPPENGEKFEEYARRRNIKFKITNHPSRGWWHKPFHKEGKTSQQIFIDFLQQNWFCKD